MFCYLKPEGCHQSYLFFLCCFSGQFMASNCHYFMQFAPGQSPNKVQLYYPRLIADELFLCDSQVCNLQYGLVEDC